MPKIGGCLKTCKKFVLLLFFVALVFFSLFLYGEAPTRLFSYNFRGFPSVVPPKGLSLKSFSSSYSVFLLFSFCLPFQDSMFSLLLSINPILEDIFGGLFHLSFRLPFPLFMFACFFVTHFPNIPFFKTNLPSFLAV